MAKPPSAPQTIAPTVATVFADFLKRVAGDDTIDKDAAQRLKAMLTEKVALDSESVRDALFGSDPHSS